MLVIIILSALAVTADIVRRRDLQRRRILRPFMPASATTESGRTAYGRHTDRMILTLT
ncbi:hypothetical protein MXC99_06780 [Thauera aromatica]|uniref:hypothetical protein n=1 Tax=Thauera aromatica TaxID=59405 RepID=UPI001FFDB1FA|nr:hypothetical protein [Thauera aromatica]MCK2087879.1 hypothetical protein [Thauera aromatica]